MRKIISVHILLAIGVTSSTQNVGIGTNTPAEKLHVAGNIKADTVKPNAVKLIPNAGAGKVLTSDVAGNAMWQTNNAAAAGNIGFGVWGDCGTNGNISEYYPIADAVATAGDNFGISVSVSGNYAIVGANFDDIGANINQGSASIYQYNGSNWIMMERLIDPGGSTGDDFGSSVSVFGNYAIVGAEADDVGANTDQGSASIYQYNGSNWVFMQQLTDASGAANDDFGHRVAISGNFAIVGAYFDDVGVNPNQGSISIYQLNGSSWVFIQKITDLFGFAGDYFGGSVSISGNYAVVGSFGDAVGANSSQGSVSFYQYNGSNWVLMEKITDASGATFDQFGYSASISGNYAIVGANYDDVGANADQGSASIYRYNGSNWVLMKKITDGNGAAGDYFGWSVSISGNYAIVGAYGDDVGINNDQGSASIYLKVGNGWGKLQYTVDPLGNVGDYFGNAISIDGNTQRFLIGVGSYGSTSGKAVFGKVN